MRFLWCFTVFVVYPCFKSAPILSLSPCLLQIYEHLSIKTEPCFGCHIPDSVKVTTDTTIRRKPTNLKIKSTFFVWSFFFIELGQSFIFRKIRVLSQYVLFPCIQVFFCCKFSHSKIWKSDSVENVDFNIWFFKTYLYKLWI